MPKRTYPHTVDDQGRKVYPITAVGKPRMTQKSMFVNGKLRPPIIKYFNFKESVQLHEIELPYFGYWVTFVLPMPKSWSKKKRAEMDGQPHQSKPDKDNLEKSLLDAVFDEDSLVYDGRVSKYWGTEGAIIIDSC